MAIRKLPKPVVYMLASRRHRLRHFLWHAVRGAWNNPRLTAEVRQLIRNKGWAPPCDRAPFDAEGKLILDNFAGEDFLYMHRQMIREVNDLLAQEGEPPLDAWPAIPRPGENPDFAVPAAWTYADPNQSAADNAQMTTSLQRLKSDAYADNPIGIWETFYTSPNNLRRLSLGALGNLLEMTIHNSFHMRWASQPFGYMPSPNLEDVNAIDPKWDSVEYDYLGDTYSSHVNPFFWYLHGWADACIDKWAAANQVTDIQWTGTWTGKLEAGWSFGQPEALTAKVREEVMTGHHQSDADLRDMEEIVQRLGSCKVIRNFYDLLLQP